MSVRKHRNGIQDKLIADFLKKFPLLLRVPPREKRKASDLLWQRLASELNTHGPPKKDVPAWKKTLADLKKSIRLKLERNQNGFADSSAQVPLTSHEETLASLWGLYDNVAETKTSTTFEDDQQDSSTYNEEDVDVNMTQDTDAHDDYDIDNFMGSSFEPEVPKVEPDVDPIFLQAYERPIPKRRSSQLEDSLVKISKKINLINDATTRTQLALNKFCALYEEKILEDKRHHLAMEQLKSEKNELKRKRLEQDRRKYNKP
ncbi:uncharacterized protein LOC115621442 [Scaptodrosophila lebanonensis]|uniref:Uncharacterized protein LOC115621442 n=1 Tax=Drosophila lebanonensis TaxID=7225 RepID=A0A6J2T223_DROLE|nr:uncharacterized protein LOC115621442 [Scaptodrosophila lebanonensis]